MGVYTLSKSAYSFTEGFKQLFGANPTAVNGQNTELTQFYIQQLTDKMLSAFKITGYPEDWDIDFLKRELLINGKIIITDSVFGVQPLTGSLTGINLSNRPNRAIITNPLISDSIERIINIDCVILKIRGDYTGLENLIRIYAYKLAACDGSIDSNLLNTRWAHIFYSDSKQASDSAKLVYDQISQGNPAVFVKRDRSAADLATATSFSHDYFNNNVKQMFIADDVQLVKSKIMKDFLSELGYNNANTDKKERLITDEVNSNLQECVGSVLDMRDTLMEEIERANSMFGLNLQFTMPFLNANETDDMSDETEEMPEETDENEEREDEKDA